MSLISTLTLYSISNDSKHTVLIHPTDTAQSHGYVVRSAHCIPHPRFMGKAAMTSIMLEIHADIGQGYAQSRGSNSLEYGRRLHSGFIEA